MEVNAKWAAAHPKEWLILRLEKMIDRIDPLELVAIGAGTLIVHDIILKSDEFVAAMSKWQNSPNSLIAGMAQSGILGTGSISIDMAYNLIAAIFPERAEEFRKKMQGNPTAFAGDLSSWLISFAIK